jgi:methionyl-tRNA formyltransferase
MPGGESIVFLGTSEFAASVLDCLAASEHERPALVLTRPDRPSGRGQRLHPPPVAEHARSLGIPLAQPESINSPEVIELIAQASPSVGNGARPTLVVCAFGALIREPLLSEYEILNVHPSLLPRWRGAAPIERAIMAGDEQTGVSIMRLTAGLDSGPVCLRARERISPEDTYGSLARRLQRLGGVLVLRALRERPPFAQQPEEEATYAEKIAPEDRALDPGRPAEELERVVRALHPHIGARVELPAGSSLGVRRAALLAAEEPEIPSGLAVVHGRLLLGCSPGALELLEVKPPGGRAMEAAAYLRGHPHALR